jgi:hypothetical protein
MISLNKIQPLSVLNNFRQAKQQEQQNPFGLSLTQPDAGLGMQVAQATTKAPSVAGSEESQIGMGDKFKYLFGGGKMAGMSYDDMSDDAKSQLGLLSTLKAKYFS